MSLSTHFYDPFHESFFTISDFNNLFDAAWDQRASKGSGNYAVQRRGEGDQNLDSGRLRPRMDLHQSKETNEMTATFELPGLKKEDVNIDVHNNRLTVSGQSTVSDTFDKDGYAVRERRFGKFSRTLPLPAGVKPEDIKANMEDGVLCVKFPMTHPDQEPKRISIS